MVAVEPREVRAAIRRLVDAQRLVAVKAKHYGVVALPSL
jgi:hypothetical protein